ncbi:hypothetical protein M0811_10928 [Anaeramoeba ignava]|uniref:Uncharacterized protein n=1 Tax=Anaeramoeba ignava TaxID=1746090 RepID=A0A9Q0LD14_ANAIG|nr:hypothetical protein M0811_10928 [Anaeramoeba ignava]
MAWLFGVKLALFIVALIILLFLFWRHHDRDRLYLLLYAPTLAAFFFQFLLAYSLDSHSNCSQLNKTMSYFIFLAVTLQPIFSNIFLFFSSEKLYRKNFLISLFLSLFVSVFFWISIFIHTTKNDLICSNFTSHGFIDIQWNRVNSHLLPSYFDLFLFSLVPFLFYRPFVIGTSFFILSVFLIGLCYFAFGQSSFISSFYLFSFSYVLFFFFDIDLIRNFGFKACFSRKAAHDIPWKDIEDDL